MSPNSLKLDSGLLLVERLLKFYDFTGGANICQVHPHKFFACIPVLIDRRLIDVQYFLRSMVGNK